RPAEADQQLGVVHAPAVLVETLPGHQQTAEDAVHVDVEQRVGDDAGALLHVPEVGQATGRTGGEDLLVELPERAADHAGVQLAEPGAHQVDAPPVDVVALAAGGRDPEVGGRPVVVGHGHQPRAPGRDDREDLPDDRLDRPRRFGGVRAGTTVVRHGTKPSHRQAYGTRPAHRGG